MATAEFASGRKTTKKKMPKKQATRRSPSSFQKAAAKTEKPRKNPSQRQVQKDRHIDERNYHWKDLSLVPDYTNYKPFDLKSINWERRLRAKADPFFDFQTYLPKVFYLDWAEYQVDLINEIEGRMVEGGKKAFGCPRGGGKTAISRAAIIRAMKFGMRKFSFFIGSREDKALQTLNFIRTVFYRSTLLRDDFPELCYPIYRLDGRASLGAHGQTYKGERTHINWGTKEVQFPTVMFDKEDIKTYLDNDPDCVIYLPDLGVDIDRYIINSSGGMIRVAGVDGSIRGEAEVHPILLTQPRPDFVLLDDVQKDQGAESPTKCIALEKLIEAAVDFLAQPDVTQAMLMPCTVIREGDISDTYLNALKKVEWAGVRNPTISKYPPGMDDITIHDEVDGKPNECGRLWETYKEIREESYRKHGNLRLANEFLKKHEKKMCDGFEITWTQRFKTDSPNPDVNEVNAVQSAMNWRFKDLESFLSEAQNRPASKTDQVGVTLKPEEVVEKITNLKKGELSIQWQDVVAFIDVQNEILFYSLFAFDYDFNGQFIDYGTFPEVKTPYFRKSQTAGWSLLTRHYYKTYPDERKAANINRNRTTSVRAPFEQKLYLALQDCVSWLLSRRFYCSGVDQSGTVGKQIKGLAIDTQWGKSSETVKRFQREYNHPRVLTYSGMAFPPQHRQIEEYDVEAGESTGWLFEHQMHPHVKEPKWIMKPRKDGTKYILADVNRLKSFLLARLACPHGKKGSISLFQGTPSQHKMYADHVADSEYPEPITARGLTKDCWQTKVQARNDNDYFDCSAGCMALASMCGASLKTTDKEEVKQPSMRDAYASRRRHK